MNATLRARTRQIWNWLCAGLWRTGLGRFCCWARWAGGWTRLSPTSCSRPGKKPYRPTSRTGRICMPRQVRQDNAYPRLARATARLVDAKINARAKELHVPPGRPRMARHRLVTTLTRRLHVTTDARALVTPELSVNLTRRPGSPARLIAPAPGAPLTMCVRMTTRAPIG